MTLLSLHGPCSGVTTSGLAWPLSMAALDPGRTLGVSNRFVASAAQVSVEEGVVSVVIPGTGSGTDFDTSSGEPEELA